MKKSIPLKEIVGFLPYGLKMLIENDIEIEQEFLYEEIQDSDIIKKGIVTLVGVNYGASFLDECLLFKSKNGDGYLQLENIKLVVRPLSDLTKEITHNGETFVPIVEIAKIADSVKKVIRMNHKQVITGFDYLNGSGEIMRFCYHHITKHFQITYVNEEEFRNECVLNQLEMFEKMFELKLDIYDWIKDGLAVDLNTI